MDALRVVGGVALMTLPARTREVAAVDAGARILGPEDEVVPAVAVDAGRRGHEPVSDEQSAVDTFQILGLGLRPLDPQPTSKLGVLVALAAGRREVAPVHGRPGVLRRKNVMSAMTADATRGACVATSRQGTMDALVVGFRFRFVARTAASLTESDAVLVERLRFRSTGRVAVGAVQVGVHRALEHLRDLIGLELLGRGGSPGVDALYLVLAQCARLCLAAPGGQGERRGQEDPRPVVPRACNGADRLQSSSVAPCCHRCYRSLAQANYGHCPYRLRRQELCQCVHVPGLVRAPMIA